MAHDRRRTIERGHALAVAAMIDLTWAIVGGVILIAVMGGVLWFVTAVLVDVIDWLMAIIEKALKGGGNRW